MTPNDSRFGDDDPSSEPLASDHVQREIAAMLRHVARDESGPDAHMPPDVEARIRDALRIDALGSSSVSSTSDASVATPVPSTVVPLPTARRRGASPAQDETRLAPRDPAITRPRVEDPDETISPPSAPLTTSAAEADARHEGGSVRSLDAHRKRRRGIGRSALALGAAAAVVIGGLGVWKGMSGPDSSAPTAADSPQVRVTNSGTPYTRGGLSTQAASLVSSTSPAITSTEQAQQEGLKGNLATKEGVEQCVNAIAPSLGAKPDKVYADFGTLDKHKAVIVVVEKDGAKQVWAVNRTCTKKSDALAGPEAVTT